MTHEIDWDRYARNVMDPLDRLPKPLRVWYREHSVLGCPRFLVARMHQMVLQQIPLKKIADAVLSAELDAIMQVRQGDDREFVSTPTPQDDAKTKAQKYFDAQTARESKGG